MYHGNILKFRMSSEELSKRFKNAQVGCDVFVHTGGIASVPERGRERPIGKVVDVFWERHVVGTVSVLLYDEEKVRGMSFDSLALEELRGEQEYPHYERYYQKYWTGLSVNPLNSPVTNNKKGEEELKPEKVIFNGITTVCYFKDGTKEIARPSKDFKDKFDPEVGVAMCIMKKLYGSRKAFVNAVEGGLVQDKGKK